MTIPRRLSPFAVLVVLAPLARVATSSPSTEEGEDLSAELELVRAEKGVPGLVAMAIQDGETVAWAAAGVRAAGSEEKMRIGDPIHLGSCSKAMTATLVATLVEEGVLKWETTIAEALPDFSKSIDAGFHGVTVEQLLQHRGGIAERRRPEIAALHENLAELEGSPVDTRREILALVLATPPLPPAKNGFDYSNFGYMTVASMLEKLTSKSWEELIVERLFEPLGMRSAGVGSPSGPDAPVGHVKDGDGWSPLPPGPAGRLHDALGPAGLLHASLEDWAKFVSQHLAGTRGEDGLVSAESFRRLQKDPGSKYAAGWGLSKHSWSWGEGSVLTHNGSDGTWHSLVFAMPEWDLVVLSATNAGESAGDAATREAKDLMLRASGFLDE